MPHLRFRGIDKECVKTLSASLPKPLATAIETSEDNFTFELVSTEFFNAGKSDKAYPFVEVLWFARSQNVKIVSAKIITDQVKALTQAADVAVIFMPLDKNDYFENGQSF